MFRKIFLDHPAEVGESFTEHFGVAAGFGTKMVIGGMGAIIHAFLPCFFKTTGSRTIFALYEKLMKNRNAVRDARTIEWMI